MSNNRLSSYFQKTNKNLIVFTLSKSCIALAFSVLLFLTGCGLTKSADLRAVENSASTLQLKTGHEVQRYTQDRSWGPFVISIQRPEVFIRYEPINGYVTQDVFDEIVAILIKNNWEESKGAKLPGYFGANLQQQGYFDLHASVVINTNRNTVSITIQGP